MYWNTCTYSHEQGAVDYRLSLFKAEKDGQEKGFSMILVRYSKYSHEQGAVNYQLPLSSSLWPKDHWWDILLTHILAVGGRKKGFSTQIPVNVHIGQCPQKWL